MNDYYVSEAQINKIATRIENSDENPLELLWDFYDTIKSIDFFLDLNPTVSRCYFQLLNKLNDEAIKDSIRTISKIKPSVLLFDDNGIRKLVKKHPALTNWLYNHIKKLMTESENYDYMYIKQLSGIIIASMGNTTQKLFKDLASISEHLKTVLIYPGLYFIYKNKANLRKNILVFLCSATKNRNQIVEAYKLMNKIIAFDKSAAGDFLDATEKTLSTDIKNSILLKNIVLLLSEIYEQPEHRARTTKLLLHAQNMAKDDLQTVRIAARKLGQEELLCSRIKIGQRIESPKDNNWKFVDHIPLDRPVVLTLGGDGTINPRNANGYAKKILEKLKKENITNTNVYSVVYDFGDTLMGCIPLNARNIQMKKYGRKIDLGNVYTKENTDPNYITELFEIALRPRIEENGKKIPVDIAIKNIRKINFVTHCHGAYTFQKLEEMMQKTMTVLGYSNAEKAKIQKQLLCIAHAPHCPLENAKSTVINFASAKDMDTKHHNKFHEEILKLDKRHRFLFSFFSGKQGNIFIAPQIFDMWFQRDFVGFDTNRLEHDFTDYDESYELLTIEGATIKELSGNILVNAVRSSANDTPITTVKSLVCENKDKLAETFAILEKNGIDMYQRILKNARTR